MRATFEKINSGLSAVNSSIVLATALVSAILWVAQLHARVAVIEENQRVIRECRDQLIAAKQDLEWLKRSIPGSK